VKINFDPGKDTIAVYEINAAGCNGYATKAVTAVSNFVNAGWKATINGFSFSFIAEDTAQSKYEWSFGDGQTGNGYKINHIYNFTRDSTVKVSLIVTNAGGCTGEDDSLIFIKAPVYKFDILVFPNPFISLTNIQVELDKASRIRIVVFDDIGRYIGTIADERQAIGKTSYIFDAARYHLSCATYFLKILVDDKVYVRPVIRVE
jgi:PKD repeat protein